MFDVSYQYDAVGNRLRKIETNSDGTPRWVYYHYDVHEAAGAFASHNNRLQWYEVYQGPTQPIEQVMFVYDGMGDPEYLVWKKADDPLYRGLRLSYDSGGKLWMVQSYEWRVDGSGVPDPATVTRTAVREFRYEGGGRARYLVQDRDPTYPPSDPDDPMPVIAGSERWAEYDGVDIYADYMVNAAAETFNVSQTYFAGIAQMGPGAVNAEFYHADQIGSTRAVSSQLSAVSYRLTYSAFGEVLETTGTVDTRYLYAGKHGYQSGLIDDWPFMQVGARWYDPMSGRFLQRDPIGIRGGLNVYVYVNGNPLLIVDPEGLLSLMEQVELAWAKTFLFITGGEKSFLDTAPGYTYRMEEGFLKGAAWGTALGAAGGFMSGGGPGAVAGGIAGCVLGAVGGAVQEGLWYFLGW